MIHLDKYREKAADAAEFLGQNGMQPVDVAIQCGSGLSSLMDQLGVSYTKVEMSSIPHFPEAAVSGHGKDALWADVNGVKVLILTGRIHIYEGYDPLTAGFPVAVAKAAGAKLFIATNAAGGLNQHFDVGDAMVHRDFINFQHDNASAHLQVDSAAERFVDPKPAYDQQASELLVKSLANAGFTAQTGVYISVRGPIFETRAELAMMRGFGADAIGMSTVPEITVCHLLGLPAAGISIITNSCFDSGPTDHADVLEQGNRAGDRLGQAIGLFLESFKTNL